jgi:glutamate N-acetyltransferase / amino-acid N-acetyltransferase
MMQAMGFDRILGGVCAPKGFLASGVSCGLKPDGRRDLAMVYSENTASAAAVFTTNQVKAAPVLLSRENVRGGTGRAVVVNSGNANAMTGERGMEDAAVMVAAAAESLGLPPEEVLVASTGPIGRYLDMDKLLGGIEQAAAELNPGGNTDAAKSIMTTDTYPKELAAEMEIGGEVVRIGAMAKGSGMIHPMLATMICVITTDVNLSPETMNGWLRQSVEWSFNRISVDGDRSTNDTVFMLANGSAHPGGYTMSREEESLLFRALCWLTGRLAMALVKDGEGSTKLLRIVVNGASSDEDAVRIARSIAGSNLVKCAFYGGIPGWGRIVAAAGASDVPVDLDNLSVFIGEYAVVQGGAPVETDPEDIARILAREEVEVTVEVGKGAGSAYFLTTDLTPRYVEFNASDKS